ncbi:unnamed protein product, partial [Sphacelaria rigidula]
GGDGGWNDIGRTGSPPPPSCFSSRYLDAYHGDQVRHDSYCEGDGGGYDYHASLHDGDDDDGRNIPLTRRLALDSRIFASSKSERQPHAQDDVERMRHDDHVLPGGESFGIAESGSGEGRFRHDFTRSADYHNANLGDLVDDGYATQRAFSGHNHRGGQNRYYDGRRSPDRWTVAMTGCGDDVAGVPYGAEGGGEQARGVSTFDGYSSDTAAAEQPHDDPVSQAYFKGEDVAPFISTIAAAPISHREERPTSPSLPHGSRFSSMRDRDRGVRRPNVYTARRAPRGSGEWREPSGGGSGGRSRPTIACGVAPAKGQWLRRVPGLATDGHDVGIHERSQKTTADDSMEVQGVNERSLSRLFEYAFADGMNQQTQGRQRHGELSGNGGSDSDNRRGEGHEG